MKRIAFVWEGTDSTIERVLRDHLSQKTLREALQHRDVKVNGVRVSPRTVVHMGDKIEVYYVEQDAPLPLLLEDADFVIVSKPQGLPTNEVPRSAETRLSQQLSMPCYACHRLDAQTGGLLLFAKNMAAKDLAREAFAQGKVQKRYQCLVLGHPNPAAQTLQHTLLKNPALARVAVYDHPVSGGRTATLRYESVRMMKRCTALEIELMTGRTHQIRAQLAHIGHPILGDDVYGDRAVNHKARVTTLQLWSTSLTLWDGRCVCISAPLVQEKEDL